ncbi:MAG: histidinol-phosphate transaminase [Reichenbachiella sp.]
MNIKILLRENIKAMTPYSSARDEFTEVADVYLDANENPFENGYNRYPDPYQKKVKERLNEIKGVSATKILLGNGSDEVLDLIYRAFCEPKVDNVVSHNPSYGMYPVLSEINNVELRKVNLEEGFQLNAQSMIDASDEQTKIFFICSPNNPSGNILAKDEIRKILDLKKGIVVIDEAYIDFAATDSWLTELDQYDNLIICQTLSKAWGLAGIRVGMCFANDEIIQALNTIKPPYNVNELSQKAALKALNNEDRFKKELSIILTEKEKLETELKSISYIEKIFPSDANFILVRVTDANHLYDFLLKRKVIVRNRSKEYLCHNCLRFTVGTPDENKKLIKGLEAYK